jgi:hypothetical protein
MPLTVFLVVLACLFGASLLGLYLGRILPREHVSKESKEVVNAFLGVIALLAAVVLGLLTFAAKTSFDTKDMEWRHAAANIIFLDRTLAHYGPETDKARKALGTTVQEKIAELEPADGARPTRTSRSFAIGMERVQEELRALAPATEAQRSIKSRAIDVGVQIAQARWYLLEELDSSMPLPFLIVLVFWLTIIFFYYGLFAPNNALVISLLFLCAVSLSGSIYLILEMDNSLEGPIAISSEPLHRALKELGK